MIKEQLITATVVNNKVDQGLTLETSAYSG